MRPICPVLKKMPNESGGTTDSAPGAGYLERGVTIFKRRTGSAVPVPKPPTGESDKRDLPRPHVPWRPPTLTKRLRREGSFLSTVPSQRPSHHGRAQGTPQREQRRAEWAPVRGRRGRALHSQIPRMAGAISALSQDLKDLKSQMNKNHFRGIPIAQPMPGSRQDRGGRPRPEGRASGAASHGSENAPLNHVLLTSHFLTKIPEI